MNILDILKIIAAVGTLATGFISLIAPRSVKGFTGLAADNPRAVTEIRAVLGGLFIGLGSAALYFREPLVYVSLGIMYLVIALVRAISMIVDKSIMRSNWISLVVEVIFGIILVL